ncbi:predicted protein [Streptomyces iranensis]|uniref:Uncharacterized protein n=1 Tax=Streptomyces iranensis TaxID=576784 RepID=A0A060ZNU2_9ACTN|nr:predicted protein [Streptomyces iranensis]
MEMMLSPPSAKNSSSTPTSASPSTSANRAHRVFSRGVAAARPVVRSAPGSGTGSAVRSSFPFAVNGSASSVMRADGSM